MFLAALSLQIKYSLLIISKRPYSPVGRTKQFVYPYIVSGLKVAATMYTSLPAKSLIEGGISFSLSLMIVYS